jgi:hypothetical protein
VEVVDFFCGEVLAGTNGGVGSAPRNYCPFMSIELTVRFERWAQAAFDRHGL